MAIGNQILRWYGVSLQPQYKAKIALYCGTLALDKVCKLFIESTLLLGSWEVHTTALCPGTMSTVPLVVRLLRRKVVGEGILHFEVGRVIFGPLSIGSLYIGVWASA